MKLDGKVALITGGAIRVGRELALSLAEAGADIVINHWKTPEQAQRTKSDIENLGRQCLSVEADMKSVAQMKSLVQRIDERYGRLDIVVHNAGNFNQQKFEDITEEIFYSSIDTILKGALFLSQAAAKLMMKYGSGKFIAIIGNSHFENLPNYIVHGIAKTGLAKLMQGLALAYSPHIQAYAVCPDSILDPDEGQLKFKDTRDSDVVLTDHNIFEKKGISLRKGNPKELAELIIYLSGCTSYMNGNVIILDGGRSLF